MEYDRLVSIMRYVSCSNVYISYTFAGGENKYMCNVTSLFFGTRKEEREYFVDLSAWNQTGCGRSPSRSKNSVDPSKGEIILPR